MPDQTSSSNSKASSSSSMVHQTSSISRASSSSRLEGTSSPNSRTSLPSRPNQASSNSRVSSLSQPNGNTSLNSREFSASSPNEISSHFGASSSSRPNQTSSPNSWASSSSTPYQTSSPVPVPSDISSPISRASLSPNSRASFASMPTSSLSYAPVTVSRVNSFKHRLGELLSFSALSRRSLSPSHSPPESFEHTHRKVVGIKVLNSNVKSQDFNPNKLLSGDIVRRVTGADGYSFPANYPGGKKSLFKELKNFLKSGVQTLFIKVMREHCKITRAALIGPRKNSCFVLRDFEDQLHEFTLEDYTHVKCLDLQAQERKRVQEQVLGMRIVTVNADYPCLEDLQTAENLSTIYSILVVPHKDIDMSRFHNVEETVMQAISWLCASKSSGVPVIFQNLQTEPFLSELESPDVDISSLARADTYGLKQSRDATSLHVVRAVRVWFAFEFPEVEVELVACDSEVRFGVTIGRTIEGFCYVTEVAAGSTADEAGLKRHLDKARALGMRLVVTKVGNEKVLPCYIANGKIRCFEISSITSILTAYRRARQPASLHVLDIDNAMCPTTVSQTPEQSSTPPSPASVYTRPM